MNTKNIFFVLFMLFRTLHAMDDATQQTKNILSEVCKCYEDQSKNFFFDVESLDEAIKSLDDLQEHDTSSEISSLKTVLMQGKLIGNLAHLLRGLGYVAGKKVTDENIKKIECIFSEFQHIKLDDHEACLLETLKKRFEAQKKALELSMLYKRETQNLIKRSKGCAHVDVVRSDYGKSGEDNLAYALVSAGKLKQFKKLYEEHSFFEDCYGAVEERYAGWQELYETIKGQFEEDADAQPLLPFFSVSALDRHGSELLHRAAWLQSREFVQFLHEHGTDLNVRTDRILSPYQCAIKGNNLPVIQYLKSCENVHLLTDELGANAPLGLAVRYAELPVFTEVLSTYSLDQLNNLISQGPILFACVAFKKMDFLRCLLDKNVRYITIKTKDKRTLLDFALEQELDDEFILFLITRGATIINSIKDEARVKRIWSLFYSRLNKNNQVSICLGLQKILEAYQGKRLFLPDGTFVGFSLSSELGDPEILYKDFLSHFDDPAKLYNLLIISGKDKVEELMSQPENKSLLFKTMESVNNRTVLEMACIVLRPELLALVLTAADFSQAPSQQVELVLHIVMRHNNAHLMKIMLDKIEDCWPDLFVSCDSMNFICKENLDGCLKAVLDKYGDKYLYHMGNNNRMPYIEAHPNIKKYLEIYSLARLKQPLVIKETTVDSLNEDLEAYALLCAKGDVAAVAKMIEEGKVDVASSDESGVTPLHVAAFFGNWNLVEYLLKHKAYPDACIQTEAMRSFFGGTTPLDVALHSFPKDVLRISLERFIAALRIVHALSRSDEPRVQELEQKLEVLLYIQHDNTEMFCRLFDEGKVDSTWYNFYIGEAKEPLLHLAIGYGARGIAEFLFDKGVDVDTRDGRGTVAAAAIGRMPKQRQDRALAMLELCASRKMNFNFRSYSNKPAIFYIVSLNWHDDIPLWKSVIKFFLDQGADIGACDTNGNTALSHMILKNHYNPEIAQFLREQGFNEEKVGHDSWYRTQALLEERGFNPLPE